LRPEDAGDSPLTPFAPALALPTARSAETRPWFAAATYLLDSAEGREIDGSADIYPYVSRGIGFQSLGQKTPFQTTTTVSLIQRPCSSTPASTVSRGEHFGVPAESLCSAVVSSVQRQLGANTKLEVSYIGTKEPTC